MLCGWRVTACCHTWALWKMLQYLKALYKCPDLLYFTYLCYTRSSVVGCSVCLSVGRDAVWAGDSGGHRNHVSEGGADPLRARGNLWGKWRPTVSRNRRCNAQRRDTSRCVSQSQAGSACLKIAHRRLSSAKYRHYVIIIIIVIMMFVYWGLSYATEHIKILRCLKLVTVSCKS